ncbi:predicted protein [Pyrenophora tritici-repentis Pt-1C-BFP]|uniref:Uncharacterized protein n=1 Tax=Pyrenophora tritici-repentis (strain Pt-1C-BFP) TaxID=426418 RepID=B2VTJ7_PYRTR|nr:uncharacterized protein PTRG_01961 [Pyrenophora tritici-repentis Pt-1C-BFP]EDU41399.1 predicted protein [Pyrenophora tritici-repentis Pt-1C-BFP]KAI1689136.1 hypothetical protein KJE20_02314 [Pyrenophora tritici-repentis]
MVGDGKTKLIAVSPYEITFVMTRTRAKDVPFEPEGVVDGNDGETDKGDVNVESRVLEDRIIKLGKELVATMSDEEETFALGMRVANVAEELGMVALLEGVIKELDDVIEELFPAKDDPELGKGVSRGRVAVKLGDMDIEVEGSMSDVDGLLSKPLIELEASSEVVGKTSDVGGGMLRLSDKDVRVGVSRSAVDVSIALDMGIPARSEDEIGEIGLSDGVRPGDCSVDMPDTLRLPGSVEGLSNEIKKELQDNRGVVLGSSISSELVSIVGIEVVGRIGLDVNSTGEDNGSFTVIEVLVSAVDESSGTVDVNVKGTLDVPNTSVSVGSPGDKAEDTVGSASLTELVESTSEEISEIVGEEIEAELIGPLGSSGTTDALESKLKKTEVDTVDVNNVDTEPENTLLITPVDGGYGGGGVTGYSKLTDDGLNEGRGTVVSGLLMLSETMVEPEISGTVNDDESPGIDKSGEV